MEVTKWLKPSISVSRIGDSASVQAATQQGPVYRRQPTQQRSPDLFGSETNCGSDEFLFKPPSARARTDGGISIPNDDLSVRARLA